MPLSVAHLPQIQRRPPCQATENRSNHAGKPSRTLQQSIECAAADLFARGDQREFSRVIARRLGMRESEVDRILTGLMLQHQRRATMYEEIVLSAPGLANEAASSVWEAA